MKSQRIERELTLTHEFGMHARPAARLVKTACRFDADISIGYRESVASAKSILGILSLGVVCGERVTVVATGVDAEEAVQAIADLFESSFDSDVEPARVPASFSSFVAISISRSGVAHPVTEEIQRLRTRISGVNDLHVDCERNRIHVLYDGQQNTLGAIIAELQSLGYEAHAPDYIWHSHSV